VARYDPIQSNTIQYNTIVIGGRGSGAVSVLVCERRGNEQRAIVASLSISPVVRGSVSEWREG